MPMKRMHIKHIFMVAYVKKEMETRGGERKIFQSLFKYLIYNFKGRHCSSLLLDYTHHEVKNCLLVVSGSLSD